MSTPRPLIRHAIAGIAAFSVVLLAVVASTAAEKYKLPRATIRFEPPDGFCLLGSKKHPIDQELIDLQARILDNYGQLLALVVECNAIDSWRAGGPTKTGKFGLLLAIKSKGKVRRYPKMTQKQLGAAMERSIRRVDMKSLEKEISSAAAKAVDGLRLGKFKLLGLLHNDDGAVYVGLIGSAVIGKVKTNNAAVSATMLVKGYLISFNLYAKYAGKQQIFNTLLATQKTFTRQFVALNNKPRSPNRKINSPTSDWTNILWSALVFGLIGVFIYLVSRRRRS